MNKNDLPEAKWSPSKDVVNKFATQHNMCVRCELPMMRCLPVCPTIVDYLAILASRGLIQCDGHHPLSPLECRFELSHKASIMDVLSVFDELVRSLLELKSQGKFRVEKVGTVPVGPRAIDQVLCLI